MSALPLLLVGLLTWRWWSALGRTLLDDVSSAGEPPGSGRDRNTGALASIRARSGRPVRRGFHRSPRGTGRTRWEGGFGRRGL